jgi:excisionase family DNA binding protein
LTPKLRVAGWTRPYGHSPDTVSGKRVRQNLVLNRKCWICLERATRLELATLSLGTEQRGCPYINKPSQPMVNSTLTPRSEVHPSQPITGFSSQFATRLLPLLPPRITLVPEELLSVREVALLLKLSTATVYSLCERGELAHVRVSNAIRVSGADVEEFVRRRRAELPRRTKRGARAARGKTAAVGLEAAATVPSAVASAPAVVQAAQPLPPPQPPPLPKRVVRPAPPGWREFRPGDKVFDLAGEPDEE